MQKNDRVDQFVKQVRGRLNQNLLWTVLTYALTLGAGASVIYGLGYVTQGYAVPRVGYLAAAAISMLAGMAVWYWRRLSLGQATYYADEHFGLKDAVTSCRNFQDDGKQGGYFDLQARQTNRFVGELSASAIPITVPVRVLAIGMVLGAAAILMAFKSNSPAVEDRLELEFATLDKTTELNKELEELVEELEKELHNDEERELVQPDKLREWVQELEETQEQKEALRQYAKLEQKLKKASSKLQQKRDEQYLERAAKELEKDDQTKQLAKALEQKKYEEAAEELNELKAEAAKPLSEQRKQVAKLKAAAKRLAAAAKSSTNKKQSSPPRPSDKQVAKSTNKSGGNSSSSLSQSQTSESRSKWRA